MGSVLSVLSALVGRGHRKTANLNIRKSEPGAHQSESSNQPVQTSLLAPTHQDIQTTNTDPDFTSDTSIPSTAQESTVECPQFRILVLGKSGCGKSSLINKVFGIQSAHVSHGCPGEADINHGFSYEDNVRFILHDSQGFQPGDDANFNIVTRFIEERSSMPKLEDRLHAIWVCLSVPTGGDRIAETGVERIVAMEHMRVPIIVVFTKYDELVNSVFRKAMRVARSSDQKKVRESSEKEAEDMFKSLCTTMEQTFGRKVPVTNVSTRAKFEGTIAKLVEITDETVQPHVDNDSRMEPASLAWAIAQRGSVETNIKASIDVGRKKYWSGLRTGINFTGRKLQWCLDVIHSDIIVVWNFNDSSAYLASDSFKARIFGLTAANRNISTSSDVLSIYAERVSGIYQDTPDNIAYMMGYIVDLIILMHRLFTAMIDVSEEQVVSVLEDYSKSTVLMQVHSDIRRFVGSISPPNLDEDDVLEEIIRLIEQHCIEAR